MKKHQSGFTLVEMLVTITIIAVVGTIGMTGFSKARQHARSMTELNAARNLAAGYLGYAAENNGKIMAGYESSPQNVVNLQGKAVSGVAAERYPWRLSPYVPSVKGIMLFNGNEKFLDRGDSDYMVSVGPNLGVNANFMGGHWGGSSLISPGGRLGKAYLGTLAEADDPSRLVVFASARGRETSDGYFEVRPPNATGRVWTSAKFTEEGAPDSHGFVDFRWGGKAVCAMLGGNVEMLTEPQLRDMRRWSHLAVRADDPNYRFTSAR